MNEKLHNLLDGEPGTGNPIGSPEEAQAFAQLRRLQDALRGNAEHDRLSAAEKSAVGAGIAAALGFESATAAGSTAAAAGGGVAWLKSLGLVLLGAGLATALFLLLESDPAASPPPATPTQGIVIEAEGTTPALFPFALAEPSAHDACIDQVAALKDSISRLEAAQSAPKPKPRRASRSRRPNFPDPVPGE